MGTRGRQSSAALAIVQPSGVIALRRPEPPVELTDEQKHEWRAVINRMPADWFPRETHGMLAQYCRHIVTARRVAQLIAAAEEPPKDGDMPFDVQAYDRLLKMQEREGRAISSLAGKMRISQSATYDKSRKKPLGVAKRPWDSEEG